MSKPYTLVVLNGCNGAERFNAWKETGGALLKRKDLGCGLNSLTFLGIFTRSQGEALMGRIGPMGTSFQEILNHVTIANNNEFVYIAGTHSIMNTDEKENFVNYLRDNMPANTCTIVTLNRHPNKLQRNEKCKKVTPGHSLIFSKDSNNALITIDPQQENYRPQDNAKMFKSWETQCYISATMVYVLHQDNRVLAPVPAAFEFMDTSEDMDTNDDDTKMSDIYGGKKKKSKHMVKKHSNKKSKKVVNKHSKKKYKTQSIKKGGKKRKLKK